MNFLFRLFFLAGALVSAPRDGRATPHDFTIYAIRMGGDATAAKPYVDRFARHLETALGLAEKSANGAFFVSRKEALVAIEQQKPGWAVVEPSLYFELRKQHKVAVLAQVASSDLNTPQIVVVAKDPAFRTLADLNGKRVFTQLADAGKYLSNVVLDGKGAAETRFQLKPVGAIMKGVRAVLRGDADAMLLDPEQLVEAKKLEGGDALRTVYTSEALPGLLVVAFPSLPLADQKKLGQTLLGLCQTPTGGPVCKEMRIQKFEQANAALLQNTEKRYEKP
ncbi:MAG TPA: PhnD/SsuA/transferrin family substrate-binding protein [Pseudomonadota bacterium]|nr:PhnD/SsuA/transferrin family substrate-binding protein [Pseudomonadota bacterium]